MRKAALLIDGENIQEGLRDYLRRNKMDLDPRLDKTIEWDSFFEYLKTKEIAIVKATLFISQDYLGRFRSSGYLMHNLYRVGIETKPTYVARAVGGYQKSILDSEFIVEALSIAYERPYIQVFILSSGDKDYYPLALKLKELGKTVYFASLPNMTSRIIGENFEVIDLTHFIKSPTINVASHLSNPMEEVLKDVTI